MDAERLRKIERVFHAALEADPSRQPAVLGELCAGDESLRREVESLLAHTIETKNVVEEPAFASEQETSRSRPSSSSAASLATGSMIAQYRVLEKIGIGGMGVVYKAEDSKLGRKVALKFLPQTLGTDAQSLGRLRREARAASALNHPNICTIYDISEDHGQPFISMEYVEGRTLRDHILGRTLETSEISKLGIQIADALSAAHAKGVVHRDIKPGNIMVMTEGRVKVLDFGLAKLIDLQDGEAPTETITETHAVTGTLPYMSPEQLRGRAVDARTDIYALGVVLYEMATGRRPFADGISPQLSCDILNSPPPAPRSVNSRIVPKLEEIILKCLEKDPEDRYQNVKEIAVDLRRMTIPSSASQRLLPTTKRFVSTSRFLWAALAVAALAVSVVAWVLFRATYYNPIRSLAVLPLVDESKDTSTQYISDGITEAVIDRLSEIPSLKVMSRNSAFRFKGKEADAQSAGRDLHVQAVLIGRIVRQVDVVILSAELVDVDDGSQIWGGQFRYSTSDLSQAQDDLARAVCEKLKVRLNSAEESRLGRRVTNNAEAYRLYLEARSRLGQRTESGVRRSIELFQQATEKDPNFALAYAGLADAYNLSNILGFQSPRESSPQAKAAATKALMLDPRLGEAYAALGEVKSHYDYDLPGARQGFLKAIELNPGYANAHLFYSGGYLTPMGKYEEAIIEMKRALDLDPLSLPLNALMANTYKWAGDYERSAQQYQHTIELEPTFFLAHVWYSDLLADRGEFEQAIGESEKCVVLGGFSSPAQAAARAAKFRQAYRTAGPRGYWQKNLEEALKVLHENETQYFPALEVASAYARVGDDNKALDWLEKSYEQRDGNLTLVKSFPEFKNLRANPRFVNLLKRMGLPE